MTPPQRGSRTVLLAAAAAAVWLPVAACSSTHNESARTPPATRVAATAVQARVGVLTITGGYLPQPASPDVAAAYFTITNAGSSSDTITKVTSNVAHEVIPMQETTTSSGVDGMISLSGSPFRRTAASSSPPATLTSC